MLIVVILTSLASMFQFHAIYSNNLLLVKLEGRDLCRKLNRHHPQLKLNGLYLQVDLLHYHLMMSLNQMGQRHLGP
jgi:hypothetical protein